MNQGLYKISPAKAGMDEQRLKNAFAILSRAIENKKIPSVAVMIGRGNYIVDSFASGYKINSDENYIVDEDTIFDCTSLTKVVVTLPLVLTLLEQGRIALSDPVSRYISEFEKGKKSLVTIKQLVTHTSGLKPSIGKNVKNWEPKEIIQQVYSRSL